MPAFSSLAQIPSAFSIGNHCSNGPPSLLHATLPPYSTATHTTSHNAQPTKEAAVQLASSLLDFGSKIYKPVLPDRQSALLGLVNTAVKMAFKHWSLEAKKPEALSIVMHNFDYSATQPKPKLEQSIQNCALKLQNYVNERVWPNGPPFPTIAFVPGSTFDKACEQAGTYRTGDVARLITGEIVVKAGALNKPKSNKNALDTIKQLLRADALELDVAPPISTNPRTGYTVLSPGTEINPKDLKQFCTKPEKDCTIPAQKLQQLMDAQSGVFFPPEMHSLPKAMSSLANPSLTGFADIFSSLILDLQRLGLDTTGPGNILSVGAGVAADRRIVKKLVPNFNMIGVDPEYARQNELELRLAEKNLKTAALNNNDQLIAATASEFAPKLHSFCKEDKPCIVMIRNIFVDGRLEENKKDWAGFFAEAWQLLKEKKILAILVTASSKKGIEAIPPVLPPAIGDTNIQPNPAAIATNYYYEVDGNNYLFYKAGPDAWYLRLTADDHQLR